MRIIAQSCEWLSPPPPNTLQLIELAGRTCYKSEGKLTPTSAPDFVRKIMKRQHASVIEHVSASMRFITNRGVTHEKVRHRIASYSQESTRYCNYTDDKFDNQITYIDPVFWPDRGPGGADAEKFDIWMETMAYLEKQYQRLIDKGATAQEARDILPNSLKTDIVMTANMREWRHFFGMRCAPGAHPQMRNIATQALKMFVAAVPVLFDDLAQAYGAAVAQAA